MTRMQVARFFANFGFRRGEESRPLSLFRYSLVITTAARWHGEAFARVVASCFIPVGEAEDSREGYIFQYPNLKSLRLPGPVGSTHSRAARRQF